MKFTDKELLFSDRHLLLINKPANLACQPTQESEKSALEELQTILEAKNGKRDSYLTPAFRLDKPVSGLLLFCRSSKSAARLQGQRKNYFIRKCYVACIEGHLQKEEGLWEDWIMHGDHRAQKATVSTGQHAVLAYRVLTVLQNCTIVEIELLTGRYHQIRYQFATRHHPIVGDHKYGSRQPYLPQAIALHHTHLSLFHPVENKILNFYSEPSILIADKLAF